MDDVAAERAPAPDAALEAADEVEVQGSDAAGPASDDEYGKAFDAALDADLLQSTLGDEDRDLLESLLAEEDSPAAGGAASGLSDRRCFLDARRGATLP